MRVPCASHARPMRVPVIGDSSAMYRKRSQLSLALLGRRRHFWDVGDVLKRNVPIYRKCPSSIADAKTGTFPETYDDIEARL